MKRFVFFSILFFFVVSALSAAAAQEEEESYSVDNPVFVDVEMGQKEEKEIEVFFVNKTDYVMLYLYVKPSSSETWGEDVFGGEAALQARHVAYITLKGVDSGSFYFKTVDQHGSVYIIKGVELPVEDDFPVILDITAFSPEESP